MKIGRAFFSAAAWAGVSILAAGCAGPVKNTGFLDSYDSFNEVNEKKYKLAVYEPQDDSIDEYFLTKEEIEELEEDNRPVPSLEAAGYGEQDIQPVLFIVPRPEWKAHYRYSDERQETLETVIRERLYRYLLRNYPHPVRVRYAYVPEDPILEGYRPIELRTAVTDINRGSGWVRYLIGYGAGTAVLQMEGRFVEIDAQTGAERELGSFAFREDHAAYPNGFINTDVIRSDYALKYAADQAIGRLAAHVREAIPAARPRPAGVAATE